MRMRDGEPFGRNVQIVIKQDVYVDDPIGIRLSLTMLVRPSHLPFDSLGDVKKLKRVKFGGQGKSSVGKHVAAFEAPRLADKIG